jgi:hypothetical protein
MKTSAMSYRREVSRRFSLAVFNVRRGIDWWKVAG